MECIKILRVGLCLLLFIGIGQITFGQLSKYPTGGQPDNHSILLIFDQADLVVPNAMTKREKGIFVYQRLKQHAVDCQKEVLHFLRDKNISFQSFCLANTICLTADEILLGELSKFSKIKKILTNAPLQLVGTIDAPHLPDLDRSKNELPWGLTLIGADVVWDKGYRGQGVVVGGHDTGVEWMHPALVNNYRGAKEAEINHNYNWHDAIHEISLLHEDSIITSRTNPCGLNTAEPCDDVGSSHGTHTVGTMVGYDPVGDMHIGVAPEASWIAVRNMERGYGSVASYLEGFEWFLAPTDLLGENPDPSKAPDVINNSWACIELEGCHPDNFEILETAINNLRTAGIVVVASAGNGGSLGCATISTPAAIYEGSFTVGSVDQNDSLSSFSSRGPVVIDHSNRNKPNVTAPGRGVLSSIKGGSYGILSGTSMAGPHVAGLVALMLSANPALAGQVEVIEDIIERSAIPKFELDSCSVLENGEQPYPNALHGFGRIDALHAVTEALDATTATIAVQKEISVGLFPNPVQDFLHISVSRDLQVEKTIIIYDLMGEIKYHGSPVSFDEIVDVRSWPSGTYFLKVLSGGRFIGAKVFQVAK
jgi:subtilisin family serine protease